MENLEEILRRMAGQNRSSPSLQMPLVDEVLDFDSFAFGPRHCDSGGLRQESIILLKEKARILASQSKYYEATSVIEEIEENEEIEEFGMKLLMAECYLQLGRENKANKWIRELRSALLEDPTLEAEDVFDLVDNLVDSKCFTSALILLPIACDLFKRSSPASALEGVFHCIRKASDCTGPMIKKGGRDRIMAIDLGVEYMVDLLSYLGGLNTDPKKIAFKQCLATTLIAYDFWSLNDNAKGVQLREEAATAMEDAFGVDGAKQHRTYANTLYNIGVGYAILNNHDRAKLAYTKAVDAFERATDFADESERRKELAMCNDKLKKLFE